mgnify:CR=1 FL=1
MHYRIWGIRWYSEFFEAAGDAFSDTAVSGSSSSAVITFFKITFPSSIPVILFTLYTISISDAASLYIWIRKTELTIYFSPQHFPQGGFVVTYCNLYCFHLLFPVYHKISIHDNCIVRICLRSVWRKRLSLLGKAFWRQKTVRSVKQRPAAIWYCKFTR